MRRFILATVVALGVSTFGLTACSSDDTSTADAGPPAQNGTVNTQAAKGSTTSYVGGVSVAVNQNQGMGSLQQLVAGAQGAQGIVTPSVGAASTKTRTITLADMVGQVSQAITSCNDACKGTVCEFKGCGSDEAGTLTITGTLSWTGGNLKCVGLTYDIDQSSVGGTKTTISLECDVTATATSLKGTIKSKGSTSAAAFLKDAGVPGGSGVGDVSWSSDTTFVDVTYANGKPTGGKVQVTATTSTAGQSYSGSAEVTFP